jgi:hypothetical protein
MEDERSTALWTEEKNKNRGDEIGKAGTMLL